MLHFVCYILLEEKEFLEQKGDLNWLLGLDHIPTKLCNLLTLNKLLAHQPWKVQADVYKVCYVMYDVGFGLQL